MSKQHIIDAIIEIGKQLGHAKKEEANVKQQVALQQRSVPVGHPIGTTLFEFDYQTGLETLEVTGENRVKDDLDYDQYFIEGRVVAATPEQAIRDVCKLWKKHGELLLEEDIQHVRRREQWYLKKANEFALAAKIIKEVATAGDSSRSIPPGP